MGRKTWDSLPARFAPARPAQHRRHAMPAGMAKAPSVPTRWPGPAAGAGRHQVFVIGGAGLYALALPQADELVLTEIEAGLDGDVFFPDWPRRRFALAASEPHVSDSGIGYRFNHFPSDKGGTCRAGFHVHGPHDHEVEHAAHHEPTGMAGRSQWSPRSSPPSARCSPTKAGRRRPTPAC